MCHAKLECKWLYTENESAKIVATFHRLRRRRITIQLHKHAQHEQHNIYSNMSEPYHRNVGITCSYIVIEIKIKVDLIITINRMGYIHALSAALKQKLNTIRR